ncbi:MAG: alpha/beta fold hydrolase [Chloroflexi bacterium]|nr:alpha/beta fold hydrolase [Chloroflexota bacterium]
MDPASRSQLIGPHERTQHAVVFFHGLTNSPQQFLHLGQRFVDRGYQVLIPRLPYHGYADRMTTDHQHLTEHDLVDVTAESVDLAAGLADEVTVCGISLGGVLAIWAALFRDVMLSAPIAPAIGLPFLPYALTSVAFGTLARLPNRFIWWDPRVKEALRGPTYAYPRFSTHALAATQRLALDLVEAGRHQPPSARSVLVISNAADLAVSNRASKLLVSRWRAIGASNVRSYEFPRQLKLFHDLVDPLQPNAQPDVVHPLLEEMLVTGAAPGDREPIAARAAHVEHAERGLHEQDRGA